jgi:hypothetical protein
MPHAPSDQIRLRIKTTTAQAVAKRMAERREPNLSAYIRGLIEADLRVQPDQDRLGLLEEAAAANHRQSVEMARSLAMAQRASYALLENGLLALLAYVPEVVGGPAADAKAEALGRSRFQVVLKAAKQNSFALLRELVAELERQSQARVRPPKT